MYRVTILYGHPEDPEAFDEYFWTVHVPLAREIDGFAGWTVGRCQSVEPGSRPPFHQAVALYGETREAIEATLATPAGKAAVDDLANFATGGVTMFYDEQRVLLSVELT